MLFFIVNGSMHTWSIPHSDVTIQMLLLLII